MSLKFSGQSYQAQCPLCHAAIRWRGGRRGPADRVAMTAAQHETGCPGWIIDPERLRNLTHEQALAEARRLHTAGPG